MFDLARAIDAYQHARHPRGADRKRRLSTQAPQPELFAMKESFALDGRLRLQQRRHQTALAGAKINASKRLIDLKRPRFACLSVNMAPVVEAKSYVAVLLNLENYDVATQRMNRPRRCENGVARLPE